jgi:hypothetical protein
MGVSSPISIPQSTRQRFVGSHNTSYKRVTWSSGGVAS